VQPAVPAQPVGAERAGAEPAVADELIALRQAFPGYRIGRRVIRGVPCYVAEARPAANAAPAPAQMAAAASAPVLSGMLAAAMGRPVPLRPAAVVAAYQDRRLTVPQCAQLFGVSRTTITKFLTGQGITLRRAGDGVDETAVVAAYRDQGLSLHQCAARFGISPRRVTAVLERHRVARRPAGRPAGAQPPRAQPPRAQPPKTQPSSASSPATTSVRSSPVTSGGANGAPKPPDFRLTNPVVSPARLAP
jgi:hypothetical protein